MTRASLRRVRRPVIAALLVGAAVFPFTYLCLMLLGVRGTERDAFAVVLAVGVASAILAAVALGKAAGAGAVMRFLAPSGASTPPVADYSREHALLQAGRIAEALDAFEEQLRTDPHNPELCLAAAEAYVGTRRSATRAAALFRDARRSPNVSPGRALYATQRLIDLYLGELAQPECALPELRRIIEQHPGSRAAAGAAIALARLKRELVRDEH